MNLSQTKRILLIRLSSLGDVLLTTPILRSIKNNYPQISIDYLIKENFADAVKLNPNIRNTITYYDSEELIRKLKENEYDFIIDLHNNFRSRKIRKKLDLPFYYFTKPSIDKFLLVHFKINRLNPIKSIPERYAESIPELNLDELGPQLFLHEQKRSEMDEKTEIVGLCPGAVHFTKRWPIEYFAELGTRLAESGYVVIVLGGKSDRKICSELSKMIPNSADLSNNNDLYLTATEMKKCKFVLCNDSGLMHTATALDVPVIAIFGSTVREFGFAPYKAKSKLIENSDLSCRPCTHIGKKKCPKRHFRCMLDLNPKIIYKEIELFSESL